MFTLLLVRNNEAHQVAFYLLSGSDAPSDLDTFETIGHGRRQHEGTFSDIPRWIQDMPEDTSRLATFSYPTSCQANPTGALSFKEPLSGALHLCSAVLLILRSSGHEWGLSGPRGSCLRCSRAGRSQQLVRWPIGSKQIPSGTRLVPRWISQTGADLFIP